MQALVFWVWQALLGILRESWNLLAAMSPYLLAGFLFAGILHVFFSVQRISRHLGKSSFSSVLKATLFGIPLPLCSCGVIPAVASLRRSGASRGATLAFLISTPTSGADSILATYSLLGPIFALYRVAASFAAGLVAGLGANIFDRRDEVGDKPAKNQTCVVCGEDATADGHTHNFTTRLRAMIAYSFGELVADIGKWLLIGTLIGGAISYFVSAELIGTYLPSPVLQMLLMLVLSIPLYICATGSLPIAAALIMKGISPGAALVFLIAGPATNAVTITVVSKTLGRRSLIIYLVSIVLVSIGMGFLFDLIVPRGLGAPSNGRIIGMFEFPEIVKIVSAAIVLGLILYQFGLKIFKRGRREAECGCTDSTSSVPAHED
ncbi:MAG: permease [Candidatus Stahlbacteria bacterium]|nr:MAG: permease [Candidatus Stahlbacteria bacterium]